MKRYLVLAEGGTRLSSAERLWISHVIAWLLHLTAQRSIDDLMGKLHDVHDG